MTTRQEKILNAVIREYVKGGQPVASASLIGKNKFDLSPATMRLEFNALEKEGMLFQPYVSSGSIPTDKAYRLFVNKLLERESDSDIISAPAKKFSQELESYNEDDDFAKFMQESARRLAHMTSSLALAYLSEDDLMLREGWEEVIKMHEFEEANSIRNLISTISRLEEKMDDFESSIREVSSEPNDIMVFIGKELNHSGAGDFSLIISRCQNPDCSRRGIIALIGPKRMEYGKKNDRKKSKN
jgi:transcriptional regulator of heat shock response